jgi:hypothetical protein
MSFDVMEEYICPSCLRTFLAYKEGQCKRCPLFSEAPLDPSDTLGD